MREAEDINPRDAELPGTLRGLKPVTPSASVARQIWYQSGYQAGRRRLNLWRGATVSLALGMTALLISQQLSHPSAPANRIFVQAPPSTTTQSPIEARAAGAGSYARLLDSLLQEGSHPWIEDNPPAGNAATPPSQNTRYRNELNLSPLN